MKVILIILLFSGLVLAQVTASRVSGDTLFIKIVGVTTEIPLIAGKKNMDSLFINESRFKDNIIADSTLILKDGIKLGLNGTKFYPLDSSKVAMMIRDSSGYIRPESYGAVGDGITDDKTAFINLASGYSANDKLVLSGATYKLNLTDTLVFDKSIIIEGNNSTLDLTDATTQWSIMIKGSPGTSYSIPSAYTAGDDMIKVPLAISSNVVRGDVLLITSDVYYGGVNITNTFDSNTHRGELVEVLSVSNDTLRLTTSLYDNYSANDTTRILKLTMPEVIIRDLKIIGSEQVSSLALVLEICKNVTLENVEIVGARHTGLFLEECYNVYVNNYKGIDFYNLPSGNGNNYGLVFGGVYHGIVSNSNIKGGRHAIDISSYLDHLASRDVLVTNSTFANSFDGNLPTVSTHPGVQYLTISNNHVLGSINCRSADVVINGNYLYSTAYRSPSKTLNAEIGMNLVDEDYGYAIITNNILYTNEFAIYPTISPAANIKSIVIDNNKIYTANRPAANSVYGLKLNKYSGIMTGTIDYLSYSNNEVHSTGNNQYEIVDFGYSGSIDTLYFKSVDIIGNKFFNDGTIEQGLEFRKVKIDNLRVLSNNFYNIQQGFSNAVVEGSNISFIEFSDNYIKRPITGTVKAILNTDTTTVLFRCQNNTIENFQSAGTNMITLVADTVYKAGDIFHNVGNNTRYTITADTTFTMDWIGE